MIQDPGCSSGQTDSRSRPSPGRGGWWTDLDGSLRAPATTSGSAAPPSPLSRPQSGSWYRDCRRIAWTPISWWATRVSTFDPRNEATELRLSDPDVVFLRAKTMISRYRVLMTAAGVGELILDGHCLRLKHGTNQSHWPTIIWPAGFTPHVHQGVVQIRNGAGRVIAEVGNEIAGGGGFLDRDSGECSGPVWWANKMKTLPDVEVYFPRQDGSLVPEEGTELFAGKLVLYEKCLQVADDVIRVKERTYAGISPLLIWPHDFTLSTEDGVVGIVDGTGGVVARVGDEVEFDAFNLTYEEAREHGGLAEITPACSGPYWAVGETFAAAAAP